MYAVLRTVYQGQRSSLSGGQPVDVVIVLMLMTGNAVYLHLSVSFIQMLKALTPAITMIYHCPLMRTLYYLHTQIWVSDSKQYGFRWGSQHYYP
jgi:hypothetical protein